MRPWGKSGWRSLNSREFVVRAREAFAWEWGAEGGRGRVVAVGSNDWGEQGGAGGQEVREGGDGLLGQEGDQAQGSLCSSAPAPQTCTPVPLPLTPHQPDDGASPGPGVHVFTAPTSLERQCRTSEQAPGLRRQTDPSALQLCDLWASYGPGFRLCKSLSLIELTRSSVQ